MHFNNFSKKPVLFLIPNKELQSLVVNLLKSKNNDCVYDFSDDENKISINKISKALESKIIVLTTYQFYELLSDYKHKIR